jgi:RNA polymerase sigma-70 factor (ECF subfamily)
MLRAMPDLRPRPSDVGAATDPEERAAPARPAWAAVARADEDARLAARVAEGDEAAFEALVTRYQHRIYAFCLRMLGDAAEAEDVAQEVFLTFFRRAADFRGESALSTWLFCIARNQTLNRIKYLDRRGRGRRRPLESEQEGVEGGLVSEAPDPEQRLDGEQTARMVQEAIGTLGEEQRVVVVLRDLEDLSYEEIATVTGLPVGTVKSRIHRARATLAARLSRIFR